MTIVLFEETGEEREVKGICLVCQRYMMREYRIKLDPATVMIVSPSGLGHAQHDFRTEETECGKDATGPDWWWRL